MTDLPDLNNLPDVNENPFPMKSEGFDWKKSNAVKFAVAGALLLFAMVIFGWQLGWFGGGSNATAKNTSPSTPPVSAPAPSPSPTDAPVANAPDAAAAPDPAAAATNPSETTPNGTDPQNPAPSGDQTAQQPDPTGRTGPNFGMPPGYMGQPGMGMMPVDPTKPPLPEDVSKWSKEDFLRARQENNPRLNDAVVYVGKKKAGEESAAQDLADLLKPLPKTEPNPNNPMGSYAQPSMPASPQLIEAIVYGLSENNTKPAQETLKKILSGEFETDDDRAATDAVIKMMALRPEQYDDVMLQLLTKPETVRKAEDASMPSSMPRQPPQSPNEMRMKAQEQLKISASDNLRLKLADYFAKASFDSNDQTVQFLLQEDPANLGAQLVLYQTDDLGSDNKTKLEQYFLNYGSQAIGLTLCVPAGVEGMPMGSGASMGPRTFGMPPGYGQYGPGGGRPQMPGGYPPSGYPSGGYSSGVGSLPTPDAAHEKLSDAERGVRLASTLWSSQLIESLTEQLNKVQSFEKGAPTITLASTLPLDNVRAAMYRMLKKRQLDGPQPLAAGGWEERLNDPGTLVLVKMLNRREPKVSKTGGRMPPPPPMTTSTGATSKAEAARKKEEAENAWFEESKKLVGIWCKRFEAAAEAQRKAARKNAPIGEPAPTKLDDFELPKEKDTRIEEAYQLNWPDKAPAGLASAKPGALKIQYFFITQTGTIKKTMTALRKGMKGSEQHEIEGGLWAEVAPKITGASAPRRSLDVVVTRADKSPFDPTQKEDPVDLEIRILAIEIADPGAKE
jgi:hypothetical protein